jgi:uncharacterized protein YegL
VRTYLIYVVLDTSASMRRAAPGQERLGAPLDHFVTLIPRMLHRLADNPIISNVAAVGVVAFNDRPEVLRPMTSLEQAVAIGRPRRGDGTDYAAVLTFLAKQHPVDVQSVNLTRAHEGLTADAARPWIFFITDGRPYANKKNQPQEVWRAARDQLTREPIGARIAAIGLPGADQDVLWELSTGDDQGNRNAFISDRRTTPGELAGSVMDAIQKSIAMSASAGLLTIESPVGMHRITGRRRAQD